MVNKSLQFIIQHVTEVKLPKSAHSGTAECYDIPADLYPYFVSFYRKSWGFADYSWMHIRTSGRF